MTEDANPWCPQRQGAILIPIPKIGHFRQGPGLFSKKIEICSTFIIPSIFHRGAAESAEMNNSKNKDARSFLALTSDSLCFSAVKIFSIFAFR